MIESISAHQENLSQLFIIVRHHRRTGSLFCHCEQIVHIFDTAKRLLPKLEFDGGIELCEPSVEMMLQCLRIR